MTCAVLVSPLQTSGREAVKHRAGFHGSGDGGRDDIVKTSQRGHEADRSMEQRGGNGGHSGTGDECGEGNGGGLQEHITGESETSSQLTPSREHQTSFRFRPFAALISAIWMVADSSLSILKNNRENPARQRQTTQPDEIASVCLVDCAYAVVSPVAFEHPQPIVPHSHLRVLPCRPRC